MSQTKRISHVYNPDNLTKQDLLDNFVVRLPVFQKLFRAVKSSKMETTEQHFLIQGQRGAGKTTLLLKLAYEIENDPDLAQWLIPVRLNEEQYNIFTLCRLWESVAEQLENRPGFEDLQDVFEKSYAEKDYPRHCFKILEKRLQREKRKLVLLIDNIVDVFKKIGEKECCQLRDILHSTSEIRIIAASARALENSFHYDKPFFEFFKIIYLDGLDKKESETLLLKLAKNYDQPKVREIIENHPARVEALRRLTGGVPRTIILLFEIFVDDSANVFEDLELVLDRITPLYKHRMDDLSGQQQAIMDAIAMNWDAIATKEIAARVRMESKAVAAQLKVLENNNLIHGIMADKKNKLYLITERFFNIWYLMRYGKKKSREQVRFLVRFLEEWCSKEELTERISKHISLARDNTLHAKGAYYMCEALAQCSPSADLQHELIVSTKEFLGKAKPELAEALSPSDRDLFVQAMALAFDKGDHVAAIRKLEDVSRQGAEVWNSCGVIWEQVGNNPARAEEFYRMAVGKGHVGAMYNLALLYEQEHQDFAKAEEFYRMAIENGNADAMGALGVLYEYEYQDFVKAEEFYRMAIEKGHAGAMNNLAVLCKREYQDFVKAEELYLMAIEKGYAGAMYNLAFLYQQELKDLVKAEEYYRMAIDQGHAEAMNNLAVLCQEEYQDYTRAEEFYRMAIEKGHAGAMCNLAVLYEHEYQDFAKAEEFYRMAIEKGHAGAMCNLAVLYEHEYQDFAKAEEFYRMAIEKGHARAMNNLALLYEQEHQDFAKAEEFYRMAIEKGHAGAMFNLALLYQQEHQDFAKAEEFYRMAIEKGDAGAMNGLAWLYFLNKKAKDEALRLAEQSVEFAAGLANNHTLAVCLLWHDRYSESMQAFRRFLQFSPGDQHENDITLYLIFLLVKRQHHLLLGLFNEEGLGLKERFKPVYYALMSRMQDEFPKDYKKMGDELRQTVEEILAESDRMAEEYR